MNLILGFCARQSLGQLAPFIGSLGATPYAGDVCLLVEDMAAETIDQLRACGVIVERAAPSAQQRMSATASRFFSYLDFLLRRGDGYAGVMLIDPATTVFQSDPFASPLPADIVYVGINRRIGDMPPVHDAVVRAYGEAVAHNMRDCEVAQPSTTIATRPGMLRYLAAMTHQLAGRTPPISGTIDVGVHNYVVHMRPLAGAWLDPGRRIAADMRGQPDGTMSIADGQVLIDGRAPPVLLRWDTDANLSRHVAVSPRFRLGRPLSRRAPCIPTMRDAVVAFYHRQRDAGALGLFLGSLRSASDSLDVHCVGELDESEQAIMARFGCTAHAVSGCEAAMAENMAHLHIGRVLDTIASGSARPDQVLVLDSVSAAFPRDPFLNKTMGLSLFREGPMRIGESDYNRDRLALFATLDEQSLRQPIISSAALRGPLQVLRDFYRRLLTELAGRLDLLNIPKVVQGLFNKLARADDLGFPVTAHPNGSEVYFELLPSDLALDTRHGVRVGGTVPGVVLVGHRESPLTLKLRIDLNLAET
jgi:hypothetical protein